MGEELAAERQAEMQLERRTRDLKVRLEYMDSFKNVSVVKVKKKFFLKKVTNNSAGYSSMYFNFGSNRS